MVQKVNSFSTVIANNSSLQNFQTGAKNTSIVLLTQGIIGIAMPSFSAGENIDINKPKISLCSNRVSIDNNNNIKTGSKILDVILTDLMTAGKLTPTDLKELIGEEISLSFYQEDLQKLAIFQNLFYRGGTEEESDIIKAELDKNLDNPNNLGSQLENIQLNLKSKDSEVQKLNTQLYAKIMDNPLIANLAAFNAITNGKIAPQHKDLLNNISVLVNCNSVQLKKIILEHLNQVQFNNLTKQGILAQTNDVEGKATRTLTPQIAIGTVAILTLTLVLSFGLEGIPNTKYNPQNSIAERMANANDFINKHISYDHGALTSDNFAASMAVSLYQIGTGFLTEFAEAFVLIPLTKYLTVKSAKAMVNLINWVENLKHSGIAGSLAGLAFYTFASIVMTDEKSIGGKHAKNTLVYFSMLAFGFFAGIVLYLDKHSQKKEFAQEIVKNSSDNKIIDFPKNRQEMDNSFDTASHFNASNKAVSSSPFNLVLLSLGVFGAHLGHISRTAMLILVILVEGPIEAMSLVTNFLENALAGNIDKKSFKQLKAFLISDEAKNMTKEEVAQRAYEILNGIKIEINNLIPSTLKSSLNLMQRGGSNFMDSIVKLLSIMGKGDVYKGIDLNDLENRSNEMNIELIEIAKNVNQELDNNPELKTSFNKYIVNQGGVLVERTNEEEEDEIKTIGQTGRAWTLKEEPEQKIS